MDDCVAAMGKGKTGVHGRFNAGKTKQRLIKKPAAGERKRATKEARVKAVAGSAVKALIEQAKRLEKLLKRQESTGAESTTALEQAAACSKKGEHAQAVDILQKELQRRSEANM